MLAADGFLVAVDFSADVGVELFEADGLTVVAAYLVDDVHQLLLRISILQLVIQVPQVLEVQFSFALVVQQVEGVSPSLFVKRVALSHLSITILVVSSLTNPSKSRALPPALSLIS